MSEELIANLGPLAPLAGIWEGNKGDDIAPNVNPTEIENNKYTPKPANRDKWFKKNRWNKRGT